MCRAREGGGVGGLDSSALNPRYLVVYGRHHLLVLKGLELLLQGTRILDLNPVCRLTHGHIPPHT